MLTPFFLFLISFVSINLFFFLFFCRPSTKTIWFWRKETSTSIHNSLGRLILMHTSLTSTPTMIINLRLLCHNQDCRFFVLCNEIPDTMRGIVPLRLYGSWFVLKTQTHDAASRGKCLLSLRCLGVHLESSKGRRAYPALFLDLGKNWIYPMRTKIKKDRSLL